MKNCTRKQKYRNELERELKGIKKYIERKLNPELMLLKDEIRSGGICDKYPELESIIGILMILKRK